MKWNSKFDEKLKYYAYAEDLDFSYCYYLKSKKENYRCIMSDQLTVRHNVSNEYRIPSYKATVMTVLHREYICYKYHPSLIYRMANAWNNLGMLLFRILRKERPVDYVKALLFLYKYHKDVLIGNFHYDEFM